MEKQCLGTSRLKFLLSKSNGDSINAIYDSWCQICLRPRSLANWITTTCKRLWQRDWTRMFQSLTLMECSLLQSGGGKGGDHAGKLQVIPALHLLHNRPIFREGRIWKRGGGGQLWMWGWGDSLALYILLRLRNISVPSSTIAQSTYSIYPVYYSVCHLVRIGIPPLPSPASECVYSPPYQRWGGGYTLACGWGGGAIPMTTGSKALHSVYSMRFRKVVH